MTNTFTRDVKATVNQINALADEGCDIVRVAVPGDEDASALPEICAKSAIPIIADIHYLPKYVFAAIDSGCAGVRVNPGNIVNFDNQIRSITKAASDANVSMRIGINAGSLSKEVYAKYNGATPEALVESAINEARLFEDVGFFDFKISVKHHDPITVIRAYELLSQAGDWPLHLGVTEAGLAFQGTIKSATVFSALLSQGIGDTIRVSLTADPTQEVKAAKEILYSLGLKRRSVEIVSCPTCGRTEVDLISLAQKVDAASKQIAKDCKAKGITKPLTIAVMGCRVNGPGEAKEADLGVAGGKGKGVLFKKGKAVKTVPESQIFNAIIDLANNMLNGE
jgi:(E)-4-hydroxy-3-methylbut-2-enyl-diphosphate synthase